MAGNTSLCRVRSGEIVEPGAREWVSVLSTERPVKSLEVAVGDAARFLEPGKRPADGTKLLLSVDKDYLIARNLESCYPLGAVLMHRGPTGANDGSDSVDTRG